MGSLIFFAFLLNILDGIITVLMFARKHVLLSFFGEAIKGIFYLPGNELELNVGTEAGFDSGA